MAISDSVDDGDRGTAAAPLVFFVTFPRSGHHYVCDLLDKCGPFKAQYCEHYHCLDPACPARDLPIARRLPCRAGRRFQKQHDFGLDFPLLAGAHYVVQYRYPLESIVSWFEFRLARGYVTDETVFDTPEEWRRLSLKDARFWRRFMKKWGVRAGDDPRILRCRYEEITTAPAMARAVVEHIRLAADASAKEAIDAHFAEQQRFAFRSIGSFRHFDRDHFARLEREVIGHDLLAKVGYAPRFS